MSEVHIAWINFYLYRNIDDRKGNNSENVYAWSGGIIYKLWKRDFYPVTVRKLPWNIYKLLL